MISFGRCALVAGQAGMPAERAVEAHAVQWLCMPAEMTRAARLQSMAACRLRVVCGDLWLLERAKRGYVMHWGNVPPHPS